MLHTAGLIQVAAPVILTFASNLITQVRTLCVQAYIANTSTGMIKMVAYLHGRLKWTREAQNSIG